jgi:hypothetical protein
VIANQPLNQLLANPGRFPKGDRKEENTNGYCKDKDVRNAFHIKNS